MPELSSKKLTPMKRPPASNAPGWISCMGLSANHRPAIRPACKSSMRTTVDPKASALIVFVAVILSGGEILQILRQSKDRSGEAQNGGYDGNPGRRAQLPVDQIADDKR